MILIKLQMKKNQELYSLYFEINKNLNCLNSIKDYFSKFFNSYLINLKTFLSNIPKTINYLLELNYEDKKNKIILNDFIFFLSNFDFEKIDFEESIDYYEKTFYEFKERNGFKIKNNDLISYDMGINIKNYKNYNLNYYKFYVPKKMRFMYEKNIKYNLISENSLFYKYKDKYLNYFKILFLNNNSCIKKLFITTFPVLKEKYFINEELFN